MVGYWIGKEHWGRGIASAALRLYLDVDRHRPLLATVAEHNAGSRRVLEKAGFELVATRARGRRAGARHVRRVALPARLGSVPAGALLDELVQLPVRHPEVGVAPAGVLADPVGLDAGGVQLGDRRRRDRRRSGPIVRSAEPSSSYGGATARTSPFDAAKSSAPTPSMAIGCEAEHVPEEGAHLHVRRCVAADEADPADLHVASPLAVSAILTGEHMFV